MRNGARSRKKASKKHAIQKEKRQREREKKKERESERETDKIQKAADMKEIHILLLLLVIL